MRYGRIGCPLCAYLVKHSWTSIQRHVMVRGRASPDDPDLAGYWAYRRRKRGPALDAGTLTLLARQENRCPRCRDPLIDPDRLPSSAEEWADWWFGVARRDIPRAASAPGPGRPPPQEPGTVLVLMHDSCRRSLTAAERRAAA